MRYCKPTVTKHHSTLVDLRAQPVSSASTNSTTNILLKMFSLCVDSLSHCTGGVGLFACLFSFICFLFFLNWLSSCSQPECFMAESDDITLAYRTVLC